MSAWLCESRGIRDKMKITFALYMELNQGRSNDDVIKWKHFPRYWPFVRGMHRSPVVSPHKGQWRGALMFSLICAWTDGQSSNRDAGDLRRQRTHYDVIVVILTPGHRLWCICIFISWPTMRLGSKICRRQVRYLMRGINGEKLG